MVNAKTTGQVRALLRKRHEGLEWAYFEEVGNRTGCGVTTFADAVAQNLWPSRGQELHGFEIKVQRSDLLHELKRPDKAETIHQYCDRWWLVLGHKDLIKTGELPPTWGLLAPRGSKLVQVIAAPKLDPKPLDRGFVCSLMRNFAAQSSAQDDVKARIDQAREAGEKYGEHLASRRVRNLEASLERETKALQELRERVRAFESASGCSLGYRFENTVAVGEAVRLLLSQQRVTEELRQARVRVDALRNLVYDQTRLRDELAKIAEGMVTDTAESRTE